MDVIRAAPLQAELGKSKPHTTTNGTPQQKVSQQQKYIAHMLAISSMLMLSEQNKTIDLCLQRQRPQWLQRHQSLPSLSPMAEGQVLFFKKQVGREKPNHLPAEANDLPNGKEGQHRFMGLHTDSFHVCQQCSHLKSMKTGSAAICTNAMLGFPGSVDAIRAAPPKPCAGRAGNFRTARNDQSPRTQPAGGSDRLRPPRTPSSGRLPSPP